MTDIELVHYESPFFVKFIKRVKPYDRAMHYHDHLEIYYMSSGERYFFIKDTLYHIKKGDLVLIGENELHKSMQASTTCHERIVVNFKREVLNDMPTTAEGSNILSWFEHGTVLRLNVAEQQFVEDLLFKLIKEDQLQPKGYTIYMKIILLELMLFIDRHDESPQRSENFDNLDPQHKKICEIIQFINHNYAEKITLESISKKYYMSYHYLSRSFKSVTGFTFVEYLNRIRIQEALKMLRSTKQSIASVSENVGFGSVTHFQRNFKLMVGVSPLKYRKLKRSSA